MAVLAGYGRVTWLISADSDEAATAGALERPLRAVDGVGDVHGGSLADSLGDECYRRPMTLSPTAPAPGASVNAGASRESFTPIGSNLLDYDNYFCRDCRRIVHVREESPGFRACAPVSAMPTDGLSFSDVRTH